MKKIKLSFIIIFALAISQTLAALSFNTGADFLKLAGGPRIIALGETAAAAQLDASSFFHNPAGLTYCENEITFVHSPAPQGDASFDYLGGIYSARALGIFALSVTSYRITPIPVLDESGNDFGQLVWDDWAFSVAYANELAKGLSLGVNGKYVYRYESNQIFGTTIGKALAADFGMVFEVPGIRGFRLGAAGENYGTTVKYSNDSHIDVLPSSVRLGAAYRLAERRDSSFDLAADLVKEKFGTFRPRMSAEYNYMDWLSLRGGYVNKEGNIAGINFGFGVVWQGFSFDMASAVNGVFDRSVYMSVSKKFFSM